MPAQVKVSGAWKGIGAVLTKVTVSGTTSWRNVSSAWVKVGGTWYKWFSAAFIDTFARTTSGSLGTSSSGGFWTAIKGVFFANGTKAQSNDAPSNNSLAATEMGNPNITAIAQNVSLGMGISFLVTDQNNWMAAVGLESDTSYSYNYSYNTPYTYTTPYSYAVGYTSSSPLGYYYTGTSYYYFTAYAPDGTFYTVTYYYWDGQYTTRTGYTLVSAGYWDHGVYTYDTGYTIGGHEVYHYGSYSIVVPNQYAAYSYDAPATNDVSGTRNVANYYSYTGTGSTNNYAPYYSGSYTANSSYSTNSTYVTTGTTTGSTVRYLLNIYQSVAGTVTTVASTALSSILSSLKVVVSGTSVTATAFSDNAQTTSVGTASTTLGSTPTATKAGIILTASAQNQGYTIGYFTANITG
jgi:hypothetical protein